MKPEKDFALEVFFSKWEFTAKYNIGGSDIESLKLSELLEMADDADRRQWDSLYLGYTEIYGAPELREVIAGLYPNLSAENILCFAGAEEGIFCAMHALLGPQDHALVCYPNYQSAAPPFHKLLKAHSKTARAHRHALPAAAWFADPARSSGTLHH